MAILTTFHNLIIKKKKHFSCLCQAVFYIEQIENGSRLHNYTLGHDGSVFLAFLS